MIEQNKNIMIISDIEGSSGCWSYKASAFKTKEWANACVDMSLDVNALVTALFEAGVKNIHVKDFHRTGYNLLPELIDSRAKIIPGYRKKPVPGIGRVPENSGLMFTGMHAASGSDGFLAHTFTSRISRIEVNGRLIPEVELFSAVTAPFGLRPIFFSACPVACAQAEEAIKNIVTYPIEKKEESVFDKSKWRAGLAEKGVESLNNSATKPYNPRGPFSVSLWLRDGHEEAKRLAVRWKLEYNDNKICFLSPDLISVYNMLARICYLTPVIERIATIALFLFNLRGRIGQSWVRRKIRKSGKHIYHLV